MCTHVGPTSNSEEAEVERFYEDLQDLLELTPKKDVLFIIGDWNAKVGSQKMLGVTGKFGFICTMECYSAIKENEILPTPKKDVLFIKGDWNAKVGSQEIP